MKKRLHIKLFLLAALLLVGITNIGAQCTISGLNANYCTNSPSTALTPGLPGGTFSGPGIMPNGSAFSPSLAGPGTHTINYNICSTTYSITLGTFAPTPTLGTSITLGDDQLSAALPIGFSFKFFCNTYTNFYISSNGYITFNSGSGAGCCQGMSLGNNTAQPNDLIAYAWTDLYPPAGGTITYTTIGTAPNRTLVASFNGINHYNGSSANACCPITAQIHLVESTNLIEIHTTTKPLYTTTTVYNTSMGIENAAGNAGYAVTGRDAAPSWTAANECYRWTPGATCSVSQTTTVSPSTISVAGNNSVCVGTTATLTAGGNTTYTWSTSSNSNIITVTPTTSTTYTVSGTNSFGCIASSPVTVTVDLTPTITAVSSAPGSGVCPTKTLTLNGGGATTYTWSGPFPVTNGVPFAPSSSGTYTVNGTNACGTASTAISVSIHPLPNITPVASTSSLCSGLSLTLTGVGNSTNYVWSGFTAPISNGVGFFPLVTTTYSVIGTSALSCTALATVPVTVVTTPVLAPTGVPAIVCLGGSATLTAMGATNYTWASISQTVNTNPLIVTPTTFGAQNYTVTKGNANCYDTKIITVITNSLPSVYAIATPTLVCSLSSSTLAVAGGINYTWTAPNTNTFTGASPVVSPSVSSVYTVAAHDGTCINTTTVLVATNPIPTITVNSATNTICRGQSVTMTANGGNTYTWTATTGTFFTPSVTDSPTTAISYNVKGDNNFGCTSAFNKIIFVNPNPTISINVIKTLVCSGGLSTLTAFGANSYSWDANANGAFTASTIVSTTASVSGPFIYSVTGSFTNTGCQSTKTVQINVFVPVLTVTGNTNTCFGGNVTLSATGGNNGSYSWNTGSGNPLNFPSITTSLTAPSVFTLSAMTNSSSVTCPATKTIALGIYYNPTITAVAQRTTMCRLYETVELYGGGGVSYLWSNGGGSPTITIGPINQVQTLNYTVTGTDANGCKSTGTVQVKVSGCTGINEASNAANAFVVYPNPSNGEFTISSTTDIVLVLSNELGQVIRTIGLSGINDRKVSVSDLAKGIYFLSGQKDNVQVNQKIIIAK